MGGGTHIHRALPPPQPCDTRSVWLQGPALPAGMGLPPSPPAVPGGCPVALSDPGSWGLLCGADCRPPPPSPPPQPRHLPPPPRAPSGSETNTAAISGRAPACAKGRKGTGWDGRGGGGTLRVGLHLRPPPEAILHVHTPTPPGASSAPPLRLAAGLGHSGTSIPDWGHCECLPHPRTPPQSSALQRGTLAPGGVSALRGRSWKASPAPTPPPAAASAVCGAGPTPPGGRTDSTQQPHTAAVTPMTNTRGNGRGGSLCTLPSPHSLGCPAGAGGGTGACRAGIVPLPPSVSSKCQHFS